jgi:hypothetical protein
MQFIRIHHRATAIIAIALAAIAISASAAWARPIDGPLHRVEQTQSVHYAVPPAARSSNAKLTGHHTPTPTAAVHAPRLGASSDSFHRGDAAIGGGVAVGIVLLVTGGAFAVRRRAQLGEA